MLFAPFANCSAFGWFLGQFIPITCGCAQCFLRRKVLEGDMTKYSCFQGYFDCCCIKAGSCGEQNCPTFCAFVEGCLCNCLAVSANRAYVMEKYDLASDPCDYRLIRINNFLQALACVCNILAIFIDELRELAWIINRIADIFYQCVTGCMTAQVAYEMDFQREHGGGGGVHAKTPHVVAVHAEPHHQHQHQHGGYDKAAGAPQFEH